MTAFNERSRPVAQEMADVFGSGSFFSAQYEANTAVGFWLRRREDGSYWGQCRVNATRFDEGEDLAAYLLEKGWALALPDAPFEYQALERIARQREFGVWGIPVDNVRRAK